MFLLQLMVYMALLLIIAVAQEIADGLIRRGGFERQARAHRAIAIISFTLVVGGVLGSLLLWDTSFGIKGLAVVRDKKVVELNRSLVWTVDGTTTFEYVQRDVLLLQLMVPSETDWAPAILTAFPLESLHEDPLRRATLQYHLLRTLPTCGLPESEQCYHKLAGIVIGRSPFADDASQQKNLDAEFQRYGWHVTQYAVIRH
ncbi:MAG: hypothetical protein KBC02_03510 [Candidatus Pacebacteria bacterium]|nr:hypothetical protein [Candidatus Paceibacterota bacterium]